MAKVLDFIATREICDPTYPFNGLYREPQAEDIAECNKASMRWWTQDELTRINLVISSAAPISQCIAAGMTLGADIDEVRIAESIRPSNRKGAFWSAFGSKFSSDVKNCRVDKEMHATLLNFGMWAAKRVYSLMGGTEQNRENAFGGEGNVACFGPSPFINYLAFQMAGSTPAMKSVGAGFELLEHHLRPFDGIRFKYSHAGEMTMLASISFLKFPT